MRRAAVFCFLVLSSTVGFGQTALSDQDRAAMEAIADRWVTTWNAHDMQAWQELFAPDADFVNIVGKQMHGRHEIFDHHQALHTGQFKDRRGEARWKDIRLLTPDVAIGHLSFHGWSTTNPALETTALATVTLAKNGGAWYIAALHNTLLSGHNISTASPTTSAEQNKETIRRHLELMNRGDWRAAAEYFAPEVQHHVGNWQSGAEAIVRGKQVLADNLEDIFRTFPDWKMEIVEMAADGDSVVVRCRVSGTHRGMAQRAVNGGLLKGAAPTNKHFQVQHIHWYKVRDGKITDHATSRDDLGMLQQLGLVPTPGPTAPPKQ